MDTAAGVPGIVQRTYMRALSSVREYVRWARRLSQYVLGTRLDHIGVSVFDLANAIIYLHKNCYCYFP